MHCIEARHLLLAAPNQRSAECARHMAACADCALFSRTVASADRLLEQAAAIAVPEAFAHRLLLTRRADRRGRWRALAFGWFAVASLVGFAAALIASQTRTAM